MAKHAVSHAILPAGRPEGTGFPEPGIGHNGGPQLLQGYKTWLWTKAYQQAWKTPPREILLRRLKRAKALGMSYHDYTLEILERGRYL